jgi:hypothetical protein
VPEPLPLAIRALHERLHFRYRGPQRLGRFDVFLIDLADWKLSLTDKTPCLWIHKPEYQSLSAFDLAEEIRDAVREAEWHTDVVLVLVDWQTAELREALRAAFTHAGHFTQFAVIDAVQQRAIFDAASPTRVMQDVLLEQIPLAQLSPYETNRFVTGNRFFGRYAYLKKILQQPKANFLIMGIRRIGKSSLLHEVQRQLDLSDPAAPDQQRRIYVDCSVLQDEDDFYKEIINQLSPRDIKRFERQSQSQRFKAQMFHYLASQHGGQITYLLDEVDGLLQNLGSDLSLFEVMRRASAKNGDACFIIAGFRHLRRAVDTIDTPLYHFGETLTLKGLPLNEVREMVIEPLEKLRIRLENRDEIAQRIYRETAGQPNLVQFYCQTLLEQLEDSSQHTLTAVSLHSVYANENFRDFLLQTFLSNTQPLERAVVFAMVAKSSAAGAEFSLKDIDTELYRRNLHVNFNPLNEACRSLTAAGILNGPNNKQYSFSIPLFARMLEETYSIDFVFDKARRDFLATEALRSESAS